MTVEVSRLTVELRKTEVRAKKKRQIKNRKTTERHKVGNPPKAKSRQILSGESI